MAASKANNRSEVTHRSAQLVGLLLWRFGLIVAGTTALYRSGRLVLQFIELPLQLEIGGALVIAGAGLVIASFLMERIVDARMEGDLKQ